MCIIFYFSILHRYLRKETPITQRKLQLDRHKYNMQYSLLFQSYITTLCILTISQNLYVSNQ